MAILWQRRCRSRWLPAPTPCLLELRGHRFRINRNSVSGFRLHQTAVDFERQTQFGEIAWPREGSAGVFLDSAQAVADGVRVANKYLSRAAHRCIVVLP